MSLLSVVIITRNEENNIADCIQSARKVSDDIIVVDAGSVDNTVRRATESGARVYSLSWKGYGASRNFGAHKAKNNWILALDADERISHQLTISIQQLNLYDTNYIYRFRRENYLGNKKIRFGTLGFETVKRIYNRKYAQWDLTLVHEKLVSPSATKFSLKGHITHFGLKNEKMYRERAIQYARMSAEKYFIEGKKDSTFKRILSPVFNSVKSYIFQLGFLDGKAGWVSAKTIAWYSWLKYFYLHHLWTRPDVKEINLASNPKVERA